MKIKWTQHTTTRTVSNIVVAVAAIVIYFVVVNLGKIWQGAAGILALTRPFFYGFIIAYLLNAPLSAIERQLAPRLDKQRKHPGLMRGLSIVVTLLLVVALLVGFISILLPQLITSVTTLMDNFPLYLDKFYEVLASLEKSLNLNTDALQKFFMSWQEITVKSTEFLSTALVSVLNVSVDITVRIVNIFIGLIVSIYLLGNKERFIAQLKKLMFALLPQSAVDSTLTIARLSNHTFTRYISGQLLDALILGILCFVCMIVLQIPFALLVSTIVMVTNVIPMFGPFIGAIPSTFIILMVSPSKAIWFVIMIVILQQIDGNILVPKIVGESTGLSPFWVLFSIFIGGGLFGLPGIILSVPVFSILYTIIKSFADICLERKGLSTDTNTYHSGKHPL